VIAGDGVQIRTSHSISGEVMTTDSDRRKKLHKVVLWSVALLITLLAFYALNHFVMSMQGLPLNWDLTPLQ
jgi:uncharacterized protein YwgA